MKYTDIYATIYQAWSKCTDAELKTKLDTALDVLANIDTVSAIARR